MLLQNKKDMESNFKSKEDKLISHVKRLELESEKVSNWCDIKIGKINDKNKALEDKVKILEEKLEEKNNDFGDKLQSSISDNKSLEYINETQSEKISNLEEVNARLMSQLSLNNSCSKIISTSLELL